jgi:hypothetical protein
VLFYAFKMFKMIKRPADCEIRSVIGFLNARNVKPADIRRQICEVYGENAMRDGMMRKWVRKSNEGRENVYPLRHLVWNSIQTPIGSGIC